MVHQTCANVSRLILISVAPQVEMGDGIGTLGGMGSGGGLDDSVYGFSVWDAI